MKSKQTRPLSLVLAGIFMLFLFTGCEQTKKGADEGTDTTSVDPPKGIIGKEQAADLFKTYTETRSPLIENYERESRGDTNFIPTRHTKFSFKVLRQYLDYIEQEAASAGVQVDTVRIYFGTYNMQRDLSPGHNTVFLVPSTDFDGENKAFEIVEEDGRPRAKAIPMDFGTGLKGMGYIDESEQRQYASFGPSPVKTNAVPAVSNGSLVLNDGNTAPPPYH